MAIRVAPFTAFHECGLHVEKKKKGENGAPIWPSRRVSTHEIKENGPTTASADKENPEIRLAWAFHEANFLVGGWLALKRARSRYCCRPLEREGSTKLQKREYADSLCIGAPQQEESGFTTRIALYRRYSRNGLRNKKNPQIRFVPALHGANFLVGG